MESNEFVPEEKPQALKILCVLTFIYTSFIGIFSLIGLIFAKPLFKLLNNLYAQMESNPDVKEEQLAQIKMILELGVGKFSVMCGVLLLIIGASFYGAVQMWQMRYKGFIFYVVANVLMLVSNAVQLKISGIVIDVLFLLLYYIQSKNLKKE
ncbi:MAG: hypothetical protein ACXVC6_13315 [Bacteroidia bacterium]